MTHCCKEVNTVNKNESFLLVTTREHKKINCRLMKDAIVVLGGSFNPVHTQHVDLLCLAKQELEATGRWNVIGGYLAVATDNYVRHKLEKRHERTIKLKHRLALVYEAIKDIPWLVNSPYQSEMLKQHDGSAFGLSQRLQRLLKNDRIHTLILIGGDRMAKNGIPVWRKSHERKQVNVTRVGIGRMMNENINLSELWEEDLKKNLIPNPHEYFILNSSTRPVSSTVVRSYLSNWFVEKNDPTIRAEIENELVNTNKLVHLSVMKYIINHENDLYIDI